MEKTVHRDKKATIVQLGTFKTKDEFGERYGMFPRPQIFYPTIFLDARRHNIEVIEDIETAKEQIESMHYITRMASVARLGM